MNETLVGLVATHGLWLIALSCFLSCLLVPIPSSLMMLAGGAFSATGDLVLWQVAGAAWAGAVLGDNAGYLLGRANAPLLDRLADGHPRRARLLERGRSLLARHGGPGVFFSTWAVAPLGPYVNMLAGAARMGWLRFAAWDLPGEAIWVALYVSLGHVFADNLEWAAELAGDLLGLIVASSLSVLLFVILFRWLLGQGPAAGGDAPTSRRARRRGRRA